MFKAYGADEVLLKPVALHTLHLALVGLLAQRLRDEEAHHGVDSGESSGSGVGGGGLGGGSLAGIGAAAALAAALRCSAVRATHRTGAAATEATTRAPRTPNTSQSLSLSLSLGLSLGGGSTSTTSLSTSAPASTATAATGHKVAVPALSCPHTDHTLFMS